MRFIFGYEEVVERLKKRVEVNDTKAMIILGCHYRDGIAGCMVYHYHKIVILVIVKNFGIGQGSLVVPMLIGKVMA